MKKPLLSFIFLLASPLLYAQFKNPGFEQAMDTARSLPQIWHIKKIAGYNFSLDDKEKHSGNNSLKIQNNSNPVDFSPFSQYVSVNTNHPKKIIISAWIKSDNTKNTPGLWCQVRDRTDKTIGFNSLQVSNVIDTGTYNWKKYSITLLIDTNAKGLVAGGFLMGEGTLWFDDMEITDAPTNIPPSKDVINLVNEFTNIIKHNSIYRDSLKWAKMQPYIGVLEQGVENTNDVRPVLDYIITQLRAVGDNHSFYQSKTMADNYAKGDINPERPSAKMLSNGIGYISVPAFGSINDTACINFATKIQELIRRLDSANNVKGWVVDLRQDGGGNMYPMIAGLGPLIGNHPLGYFVNPTNPKFNSDWTYHDGRCGVVKVKKPYKVKLPKAKVAVLVGPHTASSGEMTAISFIANSNVKLFGQPTAGYTTANQGFRLSNGAFLYLATSYTADKLFKVYKGKITPDVLVDKPANGNNDPAIDTASAWVLE